MYSSFANGTKWIDFSQNECVRKIKPKGGITASLKRLRVIELTDISVERRLKHRAVSIEVESTRPILENKKTFLRIQGFLFCFCFEEGHPGYDVMMDGEWMTGRKKLN